jgi:capsular polysaccharide transport system ATP-binding protein
MISLRGMTRIAQTGAEEWPIFDSVTINLPTDRHCAILGGEQSGKSVLIRMLSGVEEPTHGTIVRHARLSFPVGYTRAFRPHLTARQNVEHAARLYGADPREVAHFVDEVTGLGTLMDDISRRLQPRDRGMFAFAMSYAIPFDTYLIDENIGLGSSEFREICHSMLAHRAQDAGFLLATRNIKKAKDYCDMGAVIINAKLVLFDDIRDAIEAYKEDQARRPPSRTEMFGPQPLEID